MKIYLRSLLVVALGTMIISCSKEESAPSIVENRTMDVPDYWANLPVTIPLGTEYPSENLPNYGTVLDFWGEEEEDAQAPFTEIELPTKEYLNETCLFDFSKKAFGKTFYYVQNKNLGLGFHSNRTPDMPVVKLPTNVPPVNGWDLPWGNLPLVQGQPKEVLFVRAWEEFTLKFTKPIIEFGVEMTPNKQNYDSSISVTVGKMQYDQSSGYTGKTARTPGGAKFYGIKATKPFTTITIRWSKSTGTDLRSPDGFILANLRYKLAK